MRHLLRTVMALVFVCPALMAKGPEGAPDVVASVDREEALYAVGETAVFTVKLAHRGGEAVEGTMKVQLSLTNDGGAALADTPDIEIGAEPHAIEYTLTQPGFARLTAIGRSWNGERAYIKDFAVAACDPEKIAPVVTMPDDFDTFWQQGRERLAEIPLDLKQERVDKLCDEHQDTYTVSFANINGTRIHGYLLVPKAAGEGDKRMPGFVAVASAGVGKPREDFIAGHLNSISGNRAVCLYMGVYDHALGKPRDYYRRHAGEYGNIRAVPAEKEDYFYYRAALGIDRAVTWLAERDDVDASRIVYLGSSQGGGMGLVLTGLSKRITAACVNIPTFCDHLGYQAGRQPGWPGVLGERTRRQMTDEQIAAAADTLRYVDAVNFARRITAPVFLTMGYQDTTCPPTGVYAAFNTLTAPKRIVVNPHAGHAVTAAARAAYTPWLLGHLGLDPASEQ